MKTRIIHTKVWRDGWFVNLSREAKLLWLYLLTNDKINISGFYEITDRELEFDLGFAIDKTITEQLKPKAIFCMGWVFIPNIEKYNSYRNSPKNQTAFIREIECIPRVVIDTILSDTSIDTSIDTTPILLEIINHKSETKNQKPEILNNESEVEGDLPFDWKQEGLQKTKDLLNKYNLK